MNIWQTFRRWLETLFPPTYIYEVNAEGERFGYYLNKKDAQEVCALLREQGIWAHCDQHRLCERINPYDNASKRAEALRSLHKANQDNAILKHGPEWEIYK